jgi:hypothetical protein
MLLPTSLPRNGPREALNALVEFLADYVAARLIGALPEPPRDCG